MSEPTLTSFLLARLAEDEAGAVAAQKRIAGWSKADVGPWITAKHISEQVGPGAVLDAFIARHDPASVLAECEAKRRIVEPWRWGGGDEDDWRYGTHADAHSYVLRALASVYSDHPDYDPSWRA